MASRLPGAPPLIPGFHYVRPLGTGGFADVFLYEQNMPKRLVAVKVLLPESVDDEYLRMFNAEADAMARLSSHPSILTIYEASISADGRPYIVMEYCPSSHTSRYRREQIPVPEVLQLGVKIASALETAHRANMLHRDIKPSNILVSAFGSPVLADFGIAAAISGRPEDEVFAMSVPWSAPEVVDETTTGSVASEVWSLGATVYTLLAGRAPFARPGHGQNENKKMVGRIRAAVYTPIGRPDLPVRVERTLQKAMAKDPAARHASALDFAYELQLAQHELGLAYTPLEVASDAWASSAPPVNFDDGQPRGPVRSAVPLASRRPSSAERAAARQAARAAGDPRASGRARSRGAVVGIVIGAVAAVALLVVGIAAALGGMQP